MTWRLLFAAGVLEIGFARLWPSLGMVTAGAASFYLLSMKSLPAGTASAVRTGIGAAGTAILGILLLGESGGLFRVLS